MIVVTICDLKLGVADAMRLTPYAFTEQGVAMLSSVLNKFACDFGEHRVHARIREAARNAGEQ